MKIAWVLALGTWAAWCGDAVAQQQLRFVTGESLDEILEDETHRLETVELETFDRVPLSDAAETWSKTFYQLLISCSHGTLLLDREVEKQLVDTTFGCTGDTQSSRSIGVFTTAQEAQQILSSITYRPDQDYHRSWTGVTDPLCSTRSDDHEIVRMQLTPLAVEQPSKGACLAEPDFRYSEAGSLHKKKISVASVNDPPTVERESKVPLSVNSDGSCVALTGFKLDDAEASAAQVDLVPILILQLSVNSGVLRLHRRSALQSAIHAVGSDDSLEEVPLAWQLPDLLDSSLTLKGAISDLNEFLPKVEYCSSVDRIALAPDTLRVTLSDNGFCGGVAKESLSASLTVPIRILPAVDLGEVSFTKTNITISKHSSRVPVQYTFETTTEVECTVELKYDDGMLLGIDYQPSISHKTPTPVADASRSPPRMLVPMRGLIVRFGSEESSGDSTSFKLARNVCSANEVCRQVESAALSEESLDEEIVAAAQTLAVNEGVTELQVIRYPVSRFWLLWNIPLTLVHEVTVVEESGVSIQAVERRFRLQGNNDALAAQLQTLNIYSLVGGMRSHNRLNVTLSAVDGGASAIPNEQSAQLEIFASPAMENIELRYPADVVFGEFNEMSLGSVLLAYPPTYIANTALAWTVRSARGLIWWDPNSVSPAVVSRQISKNELELRGNLVDLNAALSRVRIDESNVQEVQSSFATMYEDQTYELTATALSDTISVQTLSTSSADGSVVGDIVLGVDLPARFYADLDLEITSGHCQSAAIDVNDDVSTISSKVTRMTCEAEPSESLESVFRREVQSIHVFALFPAQVAQLAGTFRVWFRGQSTDPISIDATIVTIKTSLLKVVVDANGIEVSRNELPGDNSFEWQITFGTEGDVDETFQTDYDETAVSFRLSTTVIRHGRCATDLRLDTFYPGISLSVQRLRPASSGTFAVEFSFESAFDDLPTMLIRTSTLASAQTAQSLDAIMRESKTTVSSGERDFFQLVVDNRATTALASCTSASAIEQAIRDLSIDMLRVSVESKTSPFLSGRIDYTIVISAPSVVALELVSTATAPLSNALFQLSFVNAGREAQIAVDTIAMFLETLDNTASLLASGAMRAWIPRRKRKLGIRLPVSYLPVDSNQTVTIDGIGIQGYAYQLRFTVSCTKGTISLQPKQLSHISRSSSVNPSSTLEIRGFLSTLEVNLESNSLLYAPKPGVSGYDKLEFRIESEDDQASETVAVVIKAPMSPPSLTLPPSPIVVVERDIVSITELAVSVNECREQDGPSCGINLHFSAQNGSVELATDDRAQHTPQIQIQGDVDNVNAALKGLRYRSPAHNASTEDQLLISASCMTESGEHSSPITFALPIRITRRALAIRVLLKGDIIGETSLLTTKKNSPVAFEDLLFIQVNDGDDDWSHCGEASGTGVAAACNISVDLSIFASHGLVTNFTNGGEEAFVLTEAHFSGWIGQANEFLQRQLYVPDAKFSGPDQVVINIKHGMVASEEKAATIEEAILLPVWVSPECEAPRLFWVDSETSKMSFSSPSRDPFALPEILLTREGLEERHCRDNIAFRVSMHANNGFLTMESGLATVATVDDQRTLVLKGCIRDLNLALDAVKFQFEIRRDSHIPITASVEIEVEANGGHKDTQASIASSAFLQLKFVGSTRPPDMLVKDAMLAFEDEDVLIGGAVNLEALMDLAPNSTVSIKVHNGVIYAAADGVQMDANSDQRLSSSDIRHLRSVMSNLRYSPNRNFNGIDEIDFTMEDQINTLYIYVQAQNDPPSMVVNLEEAKDWYTYPRMFLPSFHVDDPDENDLLHAEIRAINGSLLVDHMPARTFDGVIVELNLSSSSVRFTSSSERLNTIFKQRLVEFVPKVLMSHSTTQICYSALVEVCIDDGSTSGCQELTLPEQERFYSIVVSNSARNLNVSSGSSLNLSDVFEIHQRFDAINELFLRVRVSSGFIHIDTLSCGELRGMVGVEALQYPERVKMTQTIFAPDAACLNRALASIQLQNTHRANNIVVQLELFSDEMQILANGSISVNVTSNVIRKRIRAVRTSDELWLASPGTYGNLTSLLAASVVEDPAAIPPDDGASDIQLELNVSCSTCHWTYKTLVPRVSYEFAQVPSSYLRFLGLSKSLNEVLTRLMLTINSSRSAGVETINFELAPSLPQSSQKMESGWRDSTNISFPFTVQAPALIDVETGKRMRSDSAIHELVHPSSELQEIKLSLRSESITLQMKEGEAQAIGDLLAVSGDVEDARWFRVKMHVLHGRLSIPINVCCVDIRATDHELDVVGSAVALKNALAAAEFQSQDPYTGKDELRVTVAHFASPNETIASSIPIDIIAINHMPTISHRQLSSSDSFSEEEIVLDDIDFKTLEVPATPFRVSLSSVDGTFFLDNKAKQRVSVLDMQEGDTGYSNFTFEASLPDANSLLARVLYATSSTDGNCGEIYVAVDDQGHGIDTWLPKQTVSALVVRDCDKYQPEPIEEVTEVEETVTEADEFSSITETNDMAVEKTVAPSRSECLDDAYSSHLVPLIHIEGSMEGPLSTQYWEVVTLAFEVGKTWSISKASIIDSSGQSSVRSDDLTLEIDVEIGKIIFTALDGVESTSPEGAFTSSIIVVGQMDRLNAALSTLCYQCNGLCGHQDTITIQITNSHAPRPGHSHTRTIRVDQLDAYPVPRVASKASSYYSEAFQFPHESLREPELTADLVILPRVDAPVISVPESLEDPFHFMSGYASVLRLQCLPLVCDEDTPTVLDGFAVISTDFSDLLVLSVSVSHGILSLGDTLHANCIAGFVGSQSWKYVSLKATVDCINRVLSATTYVGDPNFSGADQLKVRVEYVREGETDAAFDEVVVPIVIVELNDAPYVEIVSVYYEAEEDIPLVIEDLRLQDPDARDELLCITLETDYGELALVRSEGVTLTRETLTNIGEGASWLTLKGSLRNLNAAMASVVYTSARDWNSLQDGPDGGMNGFDTITIHATDVTPFNASSTSALFVYVDPQPDPVVIGIPSNAPASIYANDPPGRIRGDEDTWMSVSGLAFSSADDTSRTTLVVSLSVEHGILSLSMLDGITFLDEATDRGPTVKVMGSFASVNAAVVDLRYLPSKDFYGMDLFVATAYAIDAYTQQETPSASIDVAITVNPVNDPPVWSIGSSTVREIHQGQGVSLAGISFTDVDVADFDCTTNSCEMDLVVEASHGLVTRLDQSSSLFSNDLTINTAAYVVLSGTPDKLNTILSEMIFELEDPGFYRADSPKRTDIKLQLTVDDRGTFGTGGPQISTTTMVFSPAVWSQFEASFLAPEGVLTLDEDTAFVFNGDLQLSNLDSAPPFRNLLELTVSCSNGAFALNGSVDGIQVVRNDSDFDGLVVIRGYFSQLNAALNGSSYVPAANWYGSEQLSLALVELDSRGKSRRAAVASIFLFVAPVCDEPRWVSLTTEPKTMQEDGYLLIDTLSLTSPDLDNEQREVEITIGVKHGGVMLSMTRGLLIQQSAYSTSEDRLIAQHVPPGHSFASSRLFFKDLAFRGRVRDVNAALKGMIFKPWLDYNSDGWPVDEIDLGATSSCGGTGSDNISSSFITVPVAVDAVNDPPVLLSQYFQAIPPLYSLHNLEVASRHSSIEAVEDLPQALESTEVFDADAGLHGDDLGLLVNISCIHCTITSEHLSQSSDFHPSDDLIVVARNWKHEEGLQLVVHGDILSLNKGLMNQLTFRGADSFYGLAFVVIKVSDLGNYGEGGEKHSAFVLGVQVKPATEAPQIHLPNYQSQEAALQLDEGASVLIQGAPALSTRAVPAHRQTPEWTVMSTSLLAHDSSTRLRSLHTFSGSEGLVASFVVPHNGGFLFSGHDANFGDELWCSDGTAVGTVLLKDIFPGYEGSQPSYLTPFSKDNRVYFAAKGPHLSWMVKEEDQDTCQSSRPSSFDTNVFFTVAVQNVWDPDETYDCPLGFRWMSTSEAQKIFVGTIGLEGHSDEPLTYFDQCGWRGYEWRGQPRKYFRFSDSKTTGAFKHAGFRDSYRVDTGFQTDLFAGILCYREVSAYQTTWGRQLWATDGTSEGTQRIARISSDAEPCHFVELNNRLYFQASSPEFGAELWSSDGSRDGTYLVADIEFGPRSSEPRFLIALDSRVFFSARTSGYGREIWFSDGESRFKFTGDEHATVGTGLLLDICIGDKSSTPQHFAVLSPATGPAVLLFQADDCAHGPELWKTDGTRAGTALVLDIYKGSLGSLPAYLTPFAGKVYFQADDGIHGAELWTTDGTSSGTVMLVDIAPGVLGSAPSFFTVLGSVNIPSGLLVFAAQAERDRLTEFWRSDGTNTGITKLFPQSREVVELNIDSLNLQLAGHKFVSIASQPEAFFYLGRKRDQGIDFQSEAASRFDAEEVARTRSITLQDVQNEGDLTLSLNCSKGWLSLGRQCHGVAVAGDGEAPDPKQAAVLTLKGSLDALNCAVEKVTYHSKPHENGWDEIHVTLSQGLVAVPGEVTSAMSAVDDPGRDGSYTVSKRMLVEIRAVNDPPSVRMASVYYAPLREWVSLTEIEITDPDSGDGILYVSIAARSGKLRATLPPNGNGGGPTALHATGDGDSSQTLEFAATVEQAKVIFGALEYVCDARYGCLYSQRDYVTVQVDDNGFTGLHGPQVTTKTAVVILV